VVKCFSSKPGLEQLHNKNRKSPAGKPIYKFKDRQHQWFTAVLTWSARYFNNTTQDVVIMADGFVSAQCEPEKNSQLFQNVLFIMYLLVQIMRPKMAIGFTMNSRRLTSGLIYLLEQTCKTHMLFMKYSI